MISYKKILTIYSNVCSTIKKWERWVKFCLFSFVLFSRPIKYMISHNHPKRCGMAWKGRKGQVTGNPNSPPSHYTPNILRPPARSSHSSSSLSDWKLGSLLLWSSHSYNFFGLPLCLSCSGSGWQLTNI